MKTVIFLMLGLIVGAASFAKSDDESLAVQTRLSIRNGNIELAIQKKDANAFVKLYDEKGFVLYQFKYNIKKGISQRFDVSQLTPGNYRILIEVDNKIVTKEFMITAMRENQILQVKG